MAEPAPPRLGVEEVRRALAEDRAAEDVTTRLLGEVGDRIAEARIVAEGRLVLAGLPITAEVFRQLDPASRFAAEAAEGAWVDAGTVVARVTGPARVLLGGERIALNFLQRLSGIATATRRAVEAVAGTDCRITHTRKTTPGLRALERYAVRMGGGVENRGSLAEAVFWKDNHWSLLDRGRTLRDALAAAPRGLPIIVEVETEPQFAQALAAGATHILADNQPPDRIAEWARRAGPHVLIQASGGIRLENAAAYARAGAKLISMGALTHSAPAAPIGMEIVIGR